MLHLLLLAAAAAAAALKTCLDIQANALHNNRPLLGNAKYHYGVLTLVADSGS